MLDKYIVAERINKMSAIYGTPKSFIAKEIGVTTGFISRLTSPKLIDGFIISKEKLILLDKFLSVRGF